MFYDRNSFLVAVSDKSWMGAMIWSPCTQSSRFNHEIVGHSKLGKWTYTFLVSKVLIKKLWMRGLNLDPFHSNTPISPQPHTNLWLCVCKFRNEFRLHLGFYAYQMGTFSSNPSIMYATNEPKYAIIIFMCNYNP